MSQVIVTFPFPTHNSDNSGEALIDQQRNILALVKEELVRDLLLNSLFHPFEKTQLTLISTHQWSTISRLSSMTVSLVSDSSTGHTLGSVIYKK